MNGVKLGRKGKIALNLLLVLLLWVGIWLNNGAPYPSAEMELRRMERENLLPPVTSSSGMKGRGSTMPTWLVSAMIGW